jgi:hypothetical protein
MSKRYRTANICNIHFSYNLRASKEPKMNRAEAVRTEPEKRRVMGLTTELSVCEKRD